MESNSWEDIVNVYWVIKMRFQDKHTKWNTYLFESSQYSNWALRGCQVNSSSSGMRIWNDVWQAQEALASVSGLIASHSHVNYRLLPLPAHWSSILFMLLLLGGSSDLCMLNLNPLRRSREEGKSPWWIWTANWVSRNWQTWSHKGKCKMHQSIIL